MGMTVLPYHVSIFHNSKSRLQHCLFLSKSFPARVNCCSHITFSRLPITLNPIDSAQKHTYHCQTVDKLQWDIKCQLLNILRSVQVCTCTSCQTCRLRGRKDRSVFRNGGDVGVYTICMRDANRPKRKHEDAFYPLPSLSPCRQTLLHLHLWYNWNAKGSCSRAQSVSLNHGLHIMGGCMGGKLDMAPPLSKLYRTDSGSKWWHQSKMDI